MQLKIVGLILNSLILTISSFAQTLSNEPIHTVFLIGDAGKDTSAGMILTLLREELLKYPNSTVAFLGDNIYPEGLIVKENNMECGKCIMSEKKLLSQLDILKEYKGNVFFIPGNHDWNMGKARGLKTIKAQADYVERYLDQTGVKNKSQANFIPQNGFPGPYTIHINGNVRIIAIDTQWWLHPQLFHKVPYFRSRKATNRRFLQELDSILNIAHANKEKVLVLAHHPLFTSGQHSLKLQPLRFLINYTPLQVLGLLGLNRLLLQDLPQPRYQKLKDNLLQVFDTYSNIIYASGHDHNLQYYKHNQNRYIVSGSGSKLSHFVRDISGCVYCDDKEGGFFILKYFADGSIEVDVVHEKMGKKPVEKYKGKANE